MPAAAGVQRAAQGRAVQVYPIKPKLKPPGTERLKLNCAILLSTSAFKFNLRRYNKVILVRDPAWPHHPVGPASAWSVSRK